MKFREIDLAFFEREYARRDFDGLLAGLRELKAANHHIEARVALALWYDGWNKRTGNARYDGRYLFYARALAGLGDLYLNCYFKYHNMAYQVGQDLLACVMDETTKLAYVSLVAAL